MDSTNKIRASMSNTSSRSAGKRQIASSHQRAEMTSTPLVGESPLRRHSRPTRSFGAFRAGMALVKARIEDVLQASFVVRKSLIRREAKGGRPAPQLLFSPVENRIVTNSLHFIWLTDGDLWTAAKTSEYPCLFGIQLIQIPVLPAVVP